MAPLSPQRRKQYPLPYVFIQHTVHFHHIHTPAYPLLSQHYRIRCSFYRLFNTDYSVLSLTMSKYITFEIDTPYRKASSTTLIQPHTPLSDVVRYVTGRFRIPGALLFDQSGNPVHDIDPLPNWACLIVDVVYSQPDGTPVHEIGLPREEKDVEVSSTTSSVPDPPPGLTEIVTKWIVEADEALNQAPQPPSISTQVTQPAQATPAPPSSTAEDYIVQIERN